MGTIAIVGAGRLGGALANALAIKGYSVEAIVKDVNRARELHSTIKISDVISANAGAVIFCVNDDAIESAAGSYLAQIREASVALHCSGALSSKALVSLREKNISCGSMHPLISVNGVKCEEDFFKNAKFCVEGDPTATSFAQGIAEKLGASVFHIETDKKTLYHAAAVMACGHVVAMFDIALEAMQKCGLTREESNLLLQPLTLGTVQNLSDSDTKNALTGPFARGDSATVIDHLEALKAVDLTDIIPIYKALGTRSIEIAERRESSIKRQMLLNEILLAEDSCK